MKRFLLLLAALLLLCSAASAKELTVLFTSDMHSYYDVTESEIDGENRQHGGAGRLKTLIDTHSNDHTIVVDAGDFAMGTLLQAGFATDAYELRLMGLAGVEVTTYGNHEFDFGSAGMASMLRAAIASGDPLPRIVIPANLDLSGDLTDAQQDLADALNEYGATRYIIKEVGGLRVAVFGLMGSDAIMCAPTSGVSWKDPVTAAKEVVQEIGDQADVIICVSHSGTKGDGKSGEDFNLVKAVPDIDVVISGHSHTTYQNAIVSGQTVLGSCGAYLSYVGRMELDVDDKGTVTCTDYELMSCDETVENDEALAETVSEYKKDISENYLSGSGYAYDQVIARSSADFPSLYDQLHGQNLENPMGELIADSYIYACGQAGEQVDFAMVAAGTIRGSIRAGDVTVSDAFEICSLGVGSDGTAGHPLVLGYFYGSDLKLLLEGDAFLGESIYPSFRMSFSGLSYTYDVGRIPFNRVSDLCIVRSDGTLEPVESHKLYRVALNMYAVNILSSVTVKARGLLSLTPRDENGVSITDDFYRYALKNNGVEVKEWTAFRDFLVSLPQGEDGVAMIPASYTEGLHRKVRKESTGLAIFANPGPATIIVLVAGALVLLLLFLLVRKLVRMIRRRARAK